MGVFNLALFLAPLGKGGRADKSWLPLVKGAGRALALAEGLLAVVALAITLNLFNTAPASAIDPSITLTQDTDNVYMTVSPTSDIVVAGQTLTVTTVGDVIGYNVTIANENANNSTMGGFNGAIYSVTGSNQKLEPWHYGYTVRKTSELIDNNGDANDLAKSAIWNEMPTLLKPSGDPLGLGRVTIASKNSASASEGDIINISYGVNLATVKTTGGSFDYETKVVYTATATPMPTPPGGETCQSGNPDNNCQVDIDENMIPVKYTGDTTTPKWTAIANPEDTNNKGEWYDYGNKQWANAVTLSSKKMYKFGGRCKSVVKASDDTGAWSPLDLWTLSTDKLYIMDPYVQSGSCDSPDGDAAINNYRSSNAIDPADILGYWVYIPRYAYQVMRRDATDKVVTDTEASAMGGFNIRFQKSPSISTDTKDRIVEPKKCDNSNANQYYQDCVGKWNAWATHPAFRWCTSINYETGERSGCTELNGIWVGKFETTGSIKAPTILPNQYHKTGEYIGAYYDIAKSIGVKDDSNTYGNGTDTVQNTHSLQSATTHMLKNSEWGAVAYLSGSRYGAGINKVLFNSSSDFKSDGDGKPSQSVTGCGPKSSNDTSQYTCEGSPNNYYYGPIGQLASTTNNVTGIYDMAGGVWELVSGNTTKIPGQSSMGTSNKDYFKTPTKLPYVNLYQNITSADQCSWNTCGGHSLYETNGWNAAGFATDAAPWFVRGGHNNGVDNPGIFATGGNEGNDVFNDTFRAALLTQ